MLRTNKPLIIYYVHHHGSGHVAWFESFAHILAIRFRILAISSDDSIIRRIEHLGIPDISTARMPSKWSPATSAQFVHTFSEAFEGVPYAREPAVRSKWLAELFLAHNPELFLSDGSIELSIMARSMGVRTVSVRLHGHFENDPTQVFAHEVSEALIAPYPEETEDESYAYKAKTFYTGYFSKYSADDRVPARDDSIAILLGYDNVSAEVLARITQNAEYSFRVIGNRTPVAQSANVQAFGRVSDIRDYISGEVVITAAGTNSIAELLALGKKIILLPEERPYDEQLHTAELLAEKEYGILAHDAMSVEEWRTTIEQAKALDISRSIKLINPHAPQQLTDWLEAHYA